MIAYGRVMFWVQTQTLNHAICSSQIRLSQILWLFNLNRTWHRSGFSQEKLFSPSQAFSFLPNYCVMVRPFVYLPNLYYRDIRVTFWLHASVYLKNIRHFYRNELTTDGTGNTQFPNPQDCLSKKASLQLTTACSRRREKHMERILKVRAGHNLKKREAQVKGPLLGLDALF